MVAMKMMHQVSNSERCCFNTSLNFQREKGPNSRGKKCSKPTCSQVLKIRRLLEMQIKLVKGKKNWQKPKVRQAYKRFLEEEKQKKKELVRKKKVTVRSDKVQVRSMPAPVKGRGRGRCSVTNPKL